MVFVKQIKSPNKTNPTHILYSMSKFGPQSIIAYTIIQTSTQKEEDG